MVVQPRSGIPTSSSRSRQRSFGGIFTRPICARARARGRALAKMGRNARKTRAYFIRPFAQGFSTRPQFARGRIRARDELALKSRASTFVPPAQTYTHGGGGCLSVCLSRVRTARPGNAGRCNSTFRSASSLLFPFFRVFSLLYFFFRPLPAALAESTPSLIRLD